MGVRKIPAAEREKLRLIDIRDFDLNACGGTHVNSTGQIGSILLRKTEKVKQGVRVEFVCGLRAVSTARHDYETLTDAAALFSTHIWEVPQQIRKSQDESKAAQKTQHRLLEEVAELQAKQMLQSAEQRHAYKLVVQYFAERDLNFIKMLAQKLTRAAPCVALLACGGTQPSLVFAQTSGLANDMGTLDEAGSAGDGHSRRRQSRHGARRRTRWRRGRTRCDGSGKADSIGSDARRGNRRSLRSGDQEKVASGRDDNL